MLFSIIFNTNRTEQQLILNQKKIEALSKLSDHGSKCRLHDKINVHKWEKPLVTHLTPGRVGPSAPNIPVRRGKLIP